MEPVNWYGEASVWPAIMTIISVWKGCGYFSIIYLAGIVGINPEYYEAARIDGAKKRHEIRYVTLPFLNGQCFSGAGQGVLRQLRFLC